MTITVSGTSITFNDNTVQTTAARGGYTVVTLTSAAPNATLTSSSNQLISIQNDTTTPTAPSVTLPDMTTLVTGTHYFVFNNTTPYNIALKDNGGTVREYITPGSNYSLQVQSNGTANGQWCVNFPVNALNFEQRNNQTLTNPYYVTYGSPVNCLRSIRLDGTNWVLVWGEYTANKLYARLYTVNTSTKVVTAGNTLTLATFGGNIVWVDGDSDGAGHALIYCSHTHSTAGYWGSAYIGLSVSGGTLYATSLVDNLYNLGVTCGYGPGMTPLAIGYLGSNNAFFLSYVPYYTGGVNYNAYLLMMTVTGTTAPVLTQSASNTTVNLGGNPNFNYYGSRTGLTTFTVGATNPTTYGYAISCNPAANTFTATARTTTTRLAIEQGSIMTYSSFSTGGYMYSSGKSVFGGYIYDVTNAGAAGVTGSLSTGFNYKANFGAAYASVGYAAPGLGTNRSSVYISSSSIIAMETSTQGPNTYRRLQCDPSSSTLNLQYSNGAVTFSVPGNFSSTVAGGSSPAGVILDANNGFYWAINSTSTYIVEPGDIATPISL